jgi:hypothetical protein
MTIERMLRNDVEVHVILVVDPTVLVTKRGHAWADDAGRGTDTSVLTSNTFLQCVTDHDERGLGVYRPRALFGYSSLPLAPLWLQGVTAEQGAQVDDVSTRLAEMGPGGHIAADLWYVVKLAAGRNAWLIAQRVTTLDQFVQAGVRLIVEGGDGYVAATREIEPELGAELTKGMARCARFLALPADRHPEFAWSPRPTLIVYDRGAARKT